MPGQLLRCQMVSTPSFSYFPLPLSVVLVVLLVLVSLISLSFPAEDSPKDQDLAQPLTLSDLMKREEDVYDTVMNEIVRQVEREREKGI